MVRRLLVLQILRDHRGLHRLRAQTQTIGWDSADVDVVQDSGSRSAAPRVPLQWMGHKMARKHNVANELS